MGWVWLFGLGVAAMAALVALGVGRVLWSFVASALMLGAAGYALQGRPTLTASPADAARLATVTDDDSLIDLRDRMLGRFTGEAAYLVAADAMTRLGERKATVQVLLGGLRIVPRSVMLWTSLGTALAGHDGGQMSPTASFAFQQAVRLAPRQPAPYFFQGLAYVRAGEFAKARPLWATALALTPATVSYHEDIRVRLDLLDRFLAMQATARR